MRGRGVKDDSMFLGQDTGKNKADWKTGASETQSWLLSCEIGLSGLNWFPVTWIQAVLTQ